MGDAWRMSALCVALFLPELVTSLFGARSSARPKRPTPADAAAHLAGAASQAAILVLCLNAGWWTPRQTRDPIVAIGAGVVIAYFAQVVWVRLHRTFSNAPAESPRGYLRTMSAYWPRVPWARALIFARTALTSTTEEVVRSIFAFGPLGTELTLGGMAFAIAFNVAMHWYQGRKHIVFHMVWTVAAIGVLVKFGLLAAIVMHVTYNVRLSSQDRTWLGYIRQWRAYEREKRAAEALTVREQ